MEQAMGDFDDALRYRSFRKVLFSTLFREILQLFFQIISDHI